MAIKKLGSKSKISDDNKQSIAAVANQLAGIEAAAEDRGRVEPLYLDSLKPNPRNNRRIAFDLERFKVILHAIKWDASYIAENDDAELERCELEAEEECTKEEFDSFKKIQKLALGIRNRNNLIHPIRYYSVDIPDSDVPQHFISSGDTRWYAHWMLGEQFIDAIEVSSTDEELLSDNEWFENVATNALNSGELYEAVVKRAAIKGIDINQTSVRKLQLFLGLENRSQAERIKTIYRDGSDYFFDLLARNIELRSVGLKSLSDLSREPDAVLKQRFEPDAHDQCIPESDPVSTEDGTHEPEISKPASKGRRNPLKISVKSYAPEAAKIVDISARSIFEFQPGGYAQFKEICEKAGVDVYSNEPNDIEARFGLLINWLRDHKVEG